MQCWISSDDPKRLDAFVAANGSGVADDVDGDPVFLARNQFYLDYTSERADGIVFTRRDNNIGRVGVELSTALRRYESSDNLILRDGDNITIPPYNATVTIRGAVNMPATVACHEAMRLAFPADDAAPTR